MNFPKTNDNSKATLPHKTLTFYIPDGTVTENELPPNGSNDKIQK